MNQNKKVDIDPSKTTFDEALKNSTPWDEMKFYSSTIIHEIFGYTKEDIKSQKFLRDTVTNIRLGSLVTITAVLTENNSKARASAGMLVCWTSAAIGVDLPSMYDLIKYINSTLTNDEDLMVFTDRLRKSNENA